MARGNGHLPTPGDGAGLLAEPPNGGYEETPAWRAWNERRGAKWGSGEWPVKWIHKDILKWNNKVPKNKHYTSWRLR